MKINWDNITYFFQIPKKWFSTLQEKIYNSYGTNFIKVNHDGEDGGIEIGVDDEAFADRVRQIANEGTENVLKVDNISPDETGNVPLGAVRSVNNSIYPDSNGNVNIPTGGGSMVDGIAPINGNVPLHAVRSINTTYLPDNIGNVDIPIVKSIDEIEPDANGNISYNAIRAINDTYYPDANGNLEMPIVSTVNGLYADQDGNVEVGTVMKVEGYSPNEYGNVWFGFEGDKWMKTNSNGTISYTDEVPITLGSSEGYLKAVDDDGEIVLRYINKEFVDTKTVDQQILAKKVFRKLITFQNTGDDDNTENLTTYSSTYIDGCQLTLNRLVSTVGSPIIKFGDILKETSSASISYKGLGGIGAAGYLEMNAVRGDITILTIDGGNIELRTNVIGQSKETVGINFSTLPNMTTLEEQPTDTDDDSLAVATCGYVQSNIKSFVKKVNDTEPDANGNVNVGTVKKVNNISPDTNGNVNVGTVKKVNNVAPDANGNVTITIGSGTVKKVDNVSPDANGNVSLGAITTTKVATNGITVSPNQSYDKYVCPTAHGHNHDAIADWDDATSSFVKKVDGKSPNANGEVSFGLAVSKWVKTDANGHLTTTDDKVISVGESDQPLTDNITVATSVSWTSPNIVIQRVQLKFKNGVLIGKTALSNQTISTTTYSG